MANVFSNKIGRRGHKVINHPVRINDLNFTDDFAEMYDKMSQNWKRQARELMERRSAALNLKYQ